MAGSEPTEAEGSSDRSWRLLGVVAVELVVVRALLFGLGYRATARVLAALTPWLAWTLGDDLDPKTVARAVESVSVRAPFGATCLMEALVCRALLDARGVETDLRVGVAKSDGDLKAHAWLVHRDEVLVGGTYADPGQYRKIADSLEP